MDSMAAQCTCNCSPPVSRAGPEFLYAGPAITVTDRWDHLKARWGINRMGHVVRPGLYKLGLATPESPVIVTANYTLSFDAVRSSLARNDAWILVLDTKGVNVWCAAGKGTFGTGELIRRIALTSLASVVSHRMLILPELGAPGVSAHEVQKYTGFLVEYGPVRSRDLPEYLRTRHATPAMRRVEFTAWDRLVLVPVEFVSVALPMVIAAVVLYFLAGVVASLAVVAAVLAGTVLFPLLLPWIPTKDFSTRGFLLGFVIALPFAAVFSSRMPASDGLPAIAGLVPLLLFSAVVGYLALNFTGSTTFTSRTGVKKEIFRYVPVMALLAGLGIACWAVAGILLYLGAGNV
jgi:hypothetical protein